MSFGPIEETPAIWAENNNGFAYNFKAKWVDGSPRPMTKFIRADLVERLKEYANHDWSCPDNPTNERGGSCTCGLAEVLKEMENE